MAIVDAAAADTDPAALPPTVIREYLPLQVGGRTLLVVGLWRDAQPALAGLDGLRRDVVIVILTAALIAAAVLFLVFRSAQTRINRQTEALVRASRMDGLTETLNHGALVEHLATSVERAREAGSSLGVAMVDIDNFRLLNDTHGHGAGDDVLLAVAGCPARPPRRRHGHGPLRARRVPGHRRARGRRPPARRPSRPSGRRSRRSGSSSSRPSACP